MLPQVDKDFEKTVVSFSKKLNSHQKAVNHFVYLANEECVIAYSYHNPLAFLAKFMSANARVFM